MKATLVNFTPDPIETAFYAFRNMHNKVGTTVEPFVCDNQKMNFMNILSKVPHQTVLEYIKMTWYIEGSRAFQQQLTRTRLAGYSIQSLRIVNVGTFADDGNYYTPPGLSEEGLGDYQFTMKYIQGEYNRMIAMGYPVEAARGILPLNINSPITMTINMRSLVHMMELRMCKNAQHEFRMIAKDMYMEVAKKICPDFAKLFFKAPCEKSGFCTSPVPCELVPGKYKQIITENAEQAGIMG